MEHLEKTQTLVLDKSTTYAFLKRVSRAKNLKHIFLLPNYGFSNIYLAEKYFDMLLTLWVEYPIYPDMFRKPFSNTLNKLCLTFYPGPVDLTMLKVLKKLVLAPVYASSSNKCWLPESLSEAKLEFFKFKHIHFCKRPKNLFLSLRYVSGSCIALAQLLKNVQHLELGLYKAEEQCISDSILILRDCKRRHVQETALNFRKSKERVFTTLR